MEDIYFKRRPVNIDFSTISIILQVSLFHSTQVNGSFNHTNDRSYIEGNSKDSKRHIESMLKNELI